MKKLLATLIALGLLSQPALAGGEVYWSKIFYHHHHHKAASLHAPSEPGRFICWANFGGAFFCFTALAIIIDEASRISAGPACATGQWDRKSYFGLVQDEAKLWRPLCSWRSRRA